MIYRRAGRRGDGSKDAEQVWCGNARKRAVIGLRAGWRGDGKEGAATQGLRAVMGSRAGWRADGNQGTVTQRLCALNYRFAGWCVDGRRALQRKGGAQFWVATPAGAVTKGRRAVMARRAGWRGNEREGFEQAVAAKQDGTQ